MYDEFKNFNKQRKSGHSFLRDDIAFRCFEKPVSDIPDTGFFIVWNEIKDSFTVLNMI